MVKPWKELNSDIEYSCNWFQVQRTRLVSPKNNIEHDFHHLLQHDCVNIIALTEQHEIITVQQYRHTIKKISLETPGGVIDASDPTPLDAAKRELKEETGFISDNWYPLGSFHANPAVLNNTCHVFLALNSRKISDQDLDLTEDLETEFIPLKVIVDRIDKEEITHGISLAGFLKFEFFRIKNPDLFK